MSNPYYSPTSLVDGVTASAALWNSERSVTEAAFDLVDGVLQQTLRFETGHLTNLAASWDAGDCAGKILGFAATGTEVALYDSPTVAQAAAEAAQAAAEAAQGLAETAQTAAETAQGLAETAQGAAEAAQGLAETAQTGAETAQGLAETAQGLAEDAQAAAEAAAAAITGTYSIKTAAFNAVAGGLYYAVMGGTYACTLPAVSAADDGKSIRIKVSGSASTYNLTLIPTGATVAGQSSVEIDMDFAEFTLVYRHATTDWSL